ncbi:hypothetical protein AGMMS50243_09790 [Betaproteobacteria bacterium]|nr:hypothetical protein AGMMS50243_09790 [Betaproteobacteria bacterium]
MKTEAKLRLADVFVLITDPRQSGKVSHNLVELLVVAVNAVLVSADTFAEIEWWAQEKLEWLRGYLKLEAGIASHDTFGRLFGLIDPDEFEPALALGWGGVARLGGGCGGGSRWQDESTYRQARRHALASGERLCR